MLKAHSMEEEATRYVLGELNPQEQRRFEAQLQQSEALRAQVRQLEEGALALALACGRRQPPQETWVVIEQALNRRSRTETLGALFRWRFWRTGWTVATVCLLGWGLSVWYLHRPARGSSPSTPTMAAAAAPRVNLSTNAVQHQPAEPTPAADELDPLRAQLLKAKAEEIGMLRSQLTALSNRMAQLSEALTQQQAQIARPGHFKFFRLTPTPATGAPGVPISPNLQRALVLAMARELGWMGTPPAAQGSGSSDGTEAPANPADQNWLSAYATGIDFVDLRSATNRTEQVVPRTTESESAPAQESSTQASTASGAAAGFVSGTNAVVAVDSSVVPRGTTLSFWGTTPSGQSQSLGQTTVGDNPTVVTVPMSAGDQMNLTVFAASPGGGSNFLYSTSATGPPR